MSYVALANITLGSSASSVTFSSIPNTFRDLVLVYSGTLTGSAGHSLRLNGDSGTNYSVVAAYNANSASFTNQTDLVPSVIFQDAPSSPVMIVVQIMDYSATDKHKTALSRTRTRNDGTDYVEAVASRWANTSAINSIVFFPNANQFASGSTFALYGIAS